VFDFVSSLYFLSDKSPNNDVPSESSTNKPKEQEEFKVPSAPVASKKKTDSNTPAQEEDEFLSLNVADDDDFLKDDKEKDDLELLRKNALESKNKARNYMRSLQINEKIIQRQKEIEEQLQKEREKLRVEELKAQKENEPEKASTKTKSDNTDGKKLARPENKETSPIKPSESGRSVGSRIRNILLSNKEDAVVKDTRCDARQILERRKLKRGEVVSRHRERRGKHFGIHNSVFYW
jgi:hypothetical protein